MVIIELHLWTIYEYTIHANGVFQKHNLPSKRTSLCRSTDIQRTNFAIRKFSRIEATS